MNIREIIRGARNTRRLTDIAIILAKYGFDDLVQRLGLPGFLHRKSVSKAGAEINTPTRLALAFEEIGPTFVKLGQLLSTRVDLLPPSYIEAFSRLQDKVEPVAFEKISEAVEHSQPHSILGKFTSINPEPRASASIAQVHSAELADGRKVVIKARRPGILKVVDMDLTLLAWLARQVEERFPEVEYLKPTELVEEFERNLRREIDLLTEAALIEKFRKTAGKTPDFPLRVPEVVWGLSSPSVLVMTEMPGRSIRDWMRDAGVSAERRAKVGLQIAEAFMAQYFDAGVFHADPHPGNFLIDKNDTVSLIDFGSLGTIPARLKARFAVALAALNNGETELFTTVLLDIGLCEEEPDLALLEMDVADHIDRVYGVPASRIDMTRIFLDMIRIAQRHKLRLPREFVMLDRSLLLIIGLCTQLDPNLSAAEVAGPYVTRLYRRNLEPQTWLKRSKLFLYNLQRALVDAPADLRRLVRSAHRGNLRFRMQVDDLYRVTREVNRISDYLASAILIAGVFLASSVMLATGSHPWLGDFLSLFGYTPDYLTEKSGSIIPEAAWTWEKMSLFGIIGIIVGCIAAFFLLLRLRRSRLH